MSQSPKIVVLTGAGISAESGVRTFRADDGLWENHRVEDIATPEGFLRNPTLVQNFYNARRATLFSPQVKPNQAHLVLAQLEQKIGDRLLIITQNIDNLHERAGTHHLIHMHGELLKVRCTRSGMVYPWTTDITEKTRCSCCTPPQRLRPHIVWFGEIPLEMEQIDQALIQCDYFISIGTSGNVYPAAGFVAQANAVGAKTIELNLEPSKTRSAFQEAHYGKASEIVPYYLQQWFL